MHFDLKYLSYTIMKMLVKPITLILSVIIIICTTSSCNAFAKSETGYSLYLENDQKWASNKIEVITADIQAKNKEHISSMFSKNAVNDSPEMDEDITAMLELFQDGILNVETNIAVGGSKSASYGDITQSLNYHFTIYTSTGKYYLNIEECVFDNIDGNNVGITTIKISDITIEHEDRHKWMGIKKDDPPGIIILDVNGEVIS